MTTADDVPKLPLEDGQIKEILKRDLPSETIVNFRWDREKREFYFVVECKDIFGDSLHIFPDTKTAKSGIMVVSDDHQGKGFGRTMMRNEIELYRACGVEKYNISACKEAGAYTWARVGFLLRENPARLQTSLRGRFNKFVKAGLLTEKEQETIDDILQFKDPTDLWRIADVPINVADRLKDVFKRAAEGDPEAETMVKDIASTSEKLKERIEENKDISFGRLILGRMMWEGQLDLNNQEQMSRIEKYVGGWKTIPPVKI